MRSGPGRKMGPRKAGRVEKMGRARRPKLEGRIGRTRWRGKRRRTRRPIDTGAPPTVPGCRLFSLPPSICGGSGFSAEQCLGAAARRALAPDLVADPFDLALQVGDVVVQVADGPWA